VPLTKTTRVTDPILYDLGELSAAERLWTWRHRQRTIVVRARRGRAGAGPGQGEVAARLGISTGAYAKLEAGRSTLLDADEVESLVGALGALRPSVGELCRIARRRSGMTLAEIAAEAPFAASKPTFLAKEESGAAEIVGFWEERGYRFPRSGSHDAKLSAAG